MAAPYDHQQLAVLCVWRRFPLINLCKLLIGVTWGGGGVLGNLGPGQLGPNLPRAGMG